MTQSNVIGVIQSDDIRDDFCQIVTKVTISVAGFHPVPSLAENMRLADIANETDS